MFRRLRDYQQRTLHHGDGDKYIALFLQMRLGKTLIAIRQAELDPGPTLVVCPLSTIASWERELGLEGLAFVSLTGSTRQKLRAYYSAPEGVRWFITNPEGVRAHPDLLLACGWRWVILDESTCIRNPRAKITKVFRRCVAPNRMILTGMPCPEGPEDFFEQMAFLRGEFMGCRTFWEWRAKYMVPGVFSWEVPPSTRKKVAVEVKKLAHCLTAEQAGLHMPRVYETRVVTLPANVRRVYRQVVREYRLGDAETKWPLVAQTWLSQLSSGIVPLQYDTERRFYSRHKIKELESLLKTELAHEQVLVFSRFTREIEEITRALPWAVVMTGSTPKARRGEIMSDFRRGRTRLLVAQEQKVGEKGIDLSAAGTIVFMSNSWSWETRSQCEARADNPNRKYPTLIIDIVAGRTVDEAVVAALTNKKQGATSLVEAIATRSREGGLL